jgi:photosystem I P700 chlorophyll a apoprotein A2
VERGGLDAGRIETRGWGETRPVAPNVTPDGADDPEGRQRNRRVEITIRREGAG